MPVAEYTVRPMRPADLPAVRALGRRVFPLPLALLMAATVAPAGVVAEDEAGAIVGALTLRTARIARRTWGILDWAVVAPDRQGQGIGGALGDRAWTLLRAQGCDEVITTGVDGYNSAAWHAAAARGLRYWPPSAQLRAVGWQWPRLLAAIPHVGISTFILRRSLAGDEPPQPDAAARPGVRAWLIAALLSLLLLPLSRVREVLWESAAPADLLAALAPAALSAGTAVLVAYLAARALAHWLAARALAVPLAFRLWESGVVGGFLLAAAFSAFIPAFMGSYYARDPTFDYGRDRAPLGKIMLAGGAASLVLFLLCSLWAGLAPVVPLWAEIGRRVGFAFGLTDTLAFFPPFQALPAGHVWAWRRAIGAAALACFLAIWLLVPLLLR